LKEIFHQELQLVDQNEDQSVVKPFYVNPDIKWTLQKWPNLAERLVAQSESPKPKVSECKVIGETKVQDPRLRKKYNFDASEMKMSYQQCVAMKKVEKNLNEDGYFFIPRSSKVLMLPYLWPLVKYVIPEKRGPVFNESELGREKVSSTSNLEKLDGQEDGVTVSLLYDDLLMTPSLDLNTKSITNFSMKRTRDQMKFCDLSLERSRILDELKIEFNKSTTSDSSTFEEPSVDLVISFEEQDSSAKRMKLEGCSSEESESWIIVKDLIQECIQRIFTEDGSAIQLVELNINSLEIEDDLEILENEAAEWTEKKFEYKRSYLPADLSEEMEKSFETLDSDDCDSDLNKTSLKQPKSVRSSRTKLVKRRSLTSRTVRRYLGGNQCFGRSLC